MDMDNFDNMKNRSEFLGFGMAFFEFKKKLEEAALTERQSEILASIEDEINRLINAPSYFDGRQDRERDLAISKAEGE